MTPVSVVAALLALDGTQVLVGAFVAIPATIVAISSLVGAWNARQAKKELRPNGGGSALDKMGVQFEQIALRLDSQDDDMADLKQAVADIASTVKHVMYEMAAEKVRAQYAEAELSARIDNERNH